MKFELILPCYNESKSLHHLINRAKQAAQASGFGPADFNLVVVENGSKDDSRRVLGELAKGELGPWFRTVLIDQNQGYGFGVLNGLKATSAPLIGWSHADQQCDPKDAFTAVGLLTSTATDPRQAMVKGVRRGRNWKDIFVSRVFEGFARVILGLKVREMNAQPKIFHRDLLATLIDPPKNFAFDLYVLYHARRNGLVLVELPVDFPPRVHGLSNWSSHFLGRYKTILNMIRYMWTLKEREGRL